MALIDKLKAIADKVRSYTHKSDLLTLDEMAENVTNVYDIGYADGERESNTKIDEVSGLLSNTLNEHTGETDTRTLEESVAKVEGILYEIGTRTCARHFYAYSSLEEIRNPLDYSNVTDFYSFCHQCFKLTYVGKINSGKGRDFTNGFNGDSKLVTIESIDVSSTSTVDRLSNMLKNCSSLENITFVGTIPAHLNVSACTKLTLASFHNIFEHLKNIKGTSTELTLTISEESEAMLIEAGIDLEAIAEETGWTIGVVAL